MTSPFDLGSMAIFHQKYVEVEPPKTSLLKKISSVLPNLEKNDNTKMT